MGKKRIQETWRIYVVILTVRLKLSEREFGRMHVRIYGKLYRVSCGGMASYGAFRGASMDLLMTSTRVMASTQKFCEGYLVSRRPREGANM